MTSGAPRGRPGAAGDEHGAGGHSGAGGTPRPALSPPNPLRFSPAALESLALGKGSQDQFALPCVSFTH